MNGCILLPRSSLGEELWRNVDYGRLLWFLLSRVDNHGTATFTSAEIELCLGISRQRLRTMLDKLRKNGIATNKQPTSNQQATNITFDFQNVAQSEQPAINQVATNKQPRKASNSPRKTIKFIPPTEEEIKSYVLEKGYHFNPEQFIPHYQSKGWKVGKEPMKDWKAACRTWEASWKEKHGEQFYYELQRTTAATPQRYTAQREASSQRMDDGIRAAMGVIARENGL